MTINSRSFRELVETRRSIRRFTAEPVSDETIERLLAVACRAPSAHNRQPWRFVVVREGEVRKRLAEAMGGRFRADLEADGVPPAEIENRLQLSTKRVQASPSLIILCLTMAEMDIYPDERRQLAERAMAVHSVAMAGGHLLLAAHAEGLGACWMCAPLFAPQEVREALGLPADWEPQGMILIGKPDGTGKRAERRPISEVTAWR